MLGREPSPSAKPPLQKNLAEVNAEHAGTEPTEADRCEAGAEGSSSEREQDVSADGALPAPRCRQGLLRDWSLEPAYFYHGPLGRSAEMHVAHHSLAT